MPFGAGKVALLGAAGSAGGGYGPDEGGKFEWIAGFTADGTGNTYGFTGISSSWDELEVRVMVEEAGVGVQVDPCYQWGGGVDASVSDYRYNDFKSYNSGLSTTREARQEPRIWFTEGGEVGAGNVSVSNPDRTGGKHTVAALGGFRYDGGATQGLIKWSCALWNGTSSSSSITAIQIDSTNGNYFPSGSTINLFGITNS